MDCVPGLELGQVRLGKKVEGLEAVEFGKQGEDAVAAVITAREGDAAGVEQTDDGVEGGEPRGVGQRGGGKEGGE